MQKEWNSIQTLLARVNPALLEGIRPGATNEELDAFAADIQLKLPVFFREFYSIHDGQSHPAQEGLIFGFELLSLKRIQETMKEFRAQVDLNAEADIQMDVFPEYFIKPLVVHTQWLIFARLGRDYLAVDLDPHPAYGNPGQVIYISHQSLILKWLALNFRGFINNFIWELGLGNFEFNEQGGFTYKKKFSATSF